MWHKSDVFTVKNREFGGDFERGWFHKEPNTGTKHHQKLQDYEHFSHINFEGFQEGSDIQICWKYILK